jgi:hypothetical protein
VRVRPPSDSVGLPAHVDVHAVLLGVSSTDESLIRTQRVERWNRDMKRSLV